MIERKILIGLITSTTYAKKIRRVWDGMLIESATGRMMCQWAIDYFDQYGKAPGIQIEDIFYARLKEGLDKEIAEEIEEELLPDLSDEYEKDGMDVDFLIAETVKHLNANKLLRLTEQINNLVETGTGSMQERLKQAEQLRNEYTPISLDRDDSVDLSDPEALRSIRRAFSKASEPVVYFPKQLGKFWNSQFVPGAFVSFLAPEKRGKTFLLLEIAMRAAKQGKRVAFFQAGDMNEAEQLKRIGVYLTRRSYLEKYCKEHWQVVRDCKFNQSNSCKKPERECDFSPFDELMDGVIDGKSRDLKELIEAYEANIDYKPCCDCKAFETDKIGKPWLKKVLAVEPIEYKDVEQAVIKFFQKYRRQFRLSTHANGSLSVNDITNILNNWEANDGFIPELIVVDYADLLVPSIKTEFRHQQNQIWKDLRKLSQTPRNSILPCVVSPTQADAKAYKRFRLELDNFSEDKRKYAHVTAMYGLNQDPDGIEKGLGLLRINEIIIREGAFSATNEITIIQDLWQGRPFLGSYF